MSARPLKLRLEQGATKRFTIEYRDPTGAPIDLTGYAGRGQIRPTPPSTEVLGEFVVTIPDPETGVVLVELPATALEHLELTGRNFTETTEASYDIEVYTQNDEHVVRLLNGQCFISPEVTKSEGI